MASSSQHKKVLTFSKPTWLSLLTAAFVACLLSTISLAQTGASFSLTASTKAVSISAGSANVSSPIGIDITLLNGFSGKVTYTVSGLPAGVTAEIGGVSTQSNALVLNVASTVAPGNYTITVTGTSGSVNSSTSLVLTVTKPSFSLSSSAGSLALVPGGKSASVTLTVKDEGGFNGNVALTASGLPSGVTASFSPSTTSSKSTLTFTPSASAASGSHTVTVTATSGTAKSTTTVVLAVAAPSFSLSSSLGALDLLVGGKSLSTTITVAGTNGFGGSVALTASGLPTGVTAAFSPATTTSKSTLTFTPSASAAPGSHTVTVTGTSGSTKSTTTVTLSIPTPSFSLLTSASTLNLHSGTPATSKISVVNPTGLSSNNISLAISGLPTGVTASFQAAAATPTTPSTLTFTTTSKAVAGTYTTTVTGTSGTTKASVTLGVTVSSASFNLSSSASDLTLSAGGASETTNISVADQGGFDSAVSLTASGVPAGVTASFSPASTKTNSVLTFKPGTTVVAGSYAVTVTGTSGSLIRTTALIVTISPSGFTLSSSASSINIAEGSTVGDKITVTGTSGSHPTVSLTASNLPKGVTAVFNPATTSSTSELTFTASSTATPGTSVATVTGTSGSITKSTNITLVIPTPSFTLSPATSSLTVAAGGTGAASTISIAPVNGFSGSVTLTATGLPAHVTVSYSANPTTSGSVLTFTATSAAVVGAYPITVTGTSGSLTSTATIELTVPGPITISVTQPTYGFNVLPGSVRRIYATVTNGSTNGVNWTVNGGATLSAGSGNWVDVTAPATGSSCSINGGVGTYSISSAKQFTLTAQSQESPAATASITVNVCNPAVQINVVPFYTTLYSGQKADIQAFVWGSVNHNVTWAITGEPSGGDGALTDNDNQDTAFSATVAGRYTLTATSAADGTKKNTATIYVTGHSMPYDVTPSMTIPVDCTVDPAMTGTTYNVGPSQTYKTIKSVPWPTLTAGSTVRIFNEDTTGSNPTTYHEYFQVSTEASRTQPVRVCGVPDSRGNLPVIDASNSTGRSDVSVYSAGYSAVGIGTPGWGGNYTGTWSSSQDLIVEGLKIQNAKPPYLYTTPAGVPATAFINAAACVRLFRSTDVVVRGLDAYNCGNGFFSDFNASEGFTAVENTLYEGNHLHNNGNSGQDEEHQFYIQGWNELIQFNVVDDYQSGARGSNFKGRGFPEIVRYNHFGDGAARQIDMVDNQDAQQYNSFEGYLSGTANSYHSRNPGDEYTADLLAAAVEAHHADYVYGNTFVNTTSGVPVHYATDHGSLEDDRIGTLWFYSNSFYEPTTTTYYSWNLFDTSGGGGDDFAEIEWPQVQAANNVFWMDSVKDPYFNWNERTNQFTTFGTNFLNASWGTGNMKGGNGTGWAAVTSKYAFQGASNVNDNFGLSNLVDVSTAPFNETTFIPNAALINAGTALPASAPKLPIRFQYGPTAVQVVRSQPLTVGAME